jgi:hypothetical protein
VMVAVQRIETGRWTAFFDVQRRYGHGFHDPVGVTWNSLVLLVRADNPFVRELTPSWQTLLLTVLVTLISFWTIARRKVLTREELLLVAWTFGAWFVPLTQANVSIWRSQAALLPIAPIVARLPRRIGLAAAAVCAIIGAALSRLYFEGRLV